MPWRESVSAIAVLFLGGQETGSAWAATPFGDGLTYSTFSFGQASTSDCGEDLCVHVTIKNTGTACAQAVPQLYVEFPAQAEQPAPILKGFAKTGLIEPGGSAEETFRLVDRDLSYW